jgi:hypothetical protein
MYNLSYNNIIEGERTGGRVWSICALDGEIRFGLKFFFCLDCTKIYTYNTDTVINIRMASKIVQNMLISSCLVV